MSTALPIPRRPQVEAARLTTRADARRTSTMGRLRESPVVMLAAANWPAGADDSYGSPDTPYDASTALDHASSCANALHADY